MHNSESKLADVQELAKSLRVPRGTQWSPPHPPLEQCVLEGKEYYAQVFYLPTPDVVARCVPRERVNGCSDELGFDGSTRTLSVDIMFKDWPIVLQGLFQIITFFLLFLFYVGHRSAFDIKRAERADDNTGEWVVRMRVVMPSDVMREGSKIRWERISKGTVLPLSVLFLY